MKVYLPPPPPRRQNLSYSSLNTLKKSDGSGKKLVAPFTLLSSLLATTCSTQATVIYHVFDGQEGRTIIDHRFDDRPNPIDDSFRAYFKVFNKGTSYDIVLGITANDVSDRVNIGRTNSKLNFFLRRNNSPLARRFDANELINGNDLSNHVRAGHAKNDVIGQHAAKWFVPGDDPVTGYIGFQIANNDSPLTGWMKISVKTISYPDPSPDSDATLMRPEYIKVLELAYNDDPSGTISAGHKSLIISPVPEPSTTAIGLGLLALGVAGVLKKRRLKKG